jgi:hypothetical protein
MDFGVDLKPEVVEKLIVPLVIGLVSWLVKDVIVGVLSKREELTRAEWKSRLLDTWAPLFYWSGVVQFLDPKTGWEKYGAKELGQVLVRSAHLIPLDHYNTLIRCLEQVTAQKTHELTLEEIKKTRAYIYGQIEILNYLLFGRHVWFDTGTYSDVFGTAKRLIRFVAQTVRDLIIWLLIISLLMALYVSYMEEWYWVLVVFVGLTALIIFFDTRRQLKLHAAIRKRQS